MIDQHYSTCQKCNRKRPLDMLTKYNKKIICSICYRQIKKKESKKK